MQAGSAAVGSKSAAQCLPENSGAEKQDEQRSCSLPSLSDEEGNDSYCGYQEALARSDPQLTDFTP